MYDYIQEHRRGFTFYIIMYLSHQVAPHNIQLICPSHGAHQHILQTCFIDGKTMEKPYQTKKPYSLQWEEREGGHSCLWANSSFDCDKEGPTLQSRHWLDVMCAEFQLTEIGNHVPLRGPISIPQQTGQC